MNPVHQNKDNKWYFWDEIWCTEYGPFDTETEANVQLSIYCEKVLGR